MTNHSSLRSPSVVVSALLCVAIIASVAMWLGRGSAPKTAPLELADLYICRTPSDSALASRWFRAFPGYSSFEKGALVRYRCTFCNTHMPSNLSLETEDIVLISGMEQ